MEPTTSFGSAVVVGWGATLGVNELVGFGVLVGTADVVGRPGVRVVEVVAVGVGTLAPERGVDVGLEVGVPLPPWLGRSAPGEEDVGDPEGVLGAGEAGGCGDERQGGVTMPEP